MKYIASILLFLGSLFSVTVDVIGPNKQYDLTKLTLEVRTNATLTNALIQAVSLKNATNFKFYFQNALNTAQTNQLHLLLTNHTFNSNSLTYNITSEILIDVTNEIVSNLEQLIVDATNASTDVGLSNFLTNQTNSIYASIRDISNHTTNLYSNITRGLLDASNNTAATSNFALNNHIINMLNFTNLSNRDNGISNQVGNNATIASNNNTATATYTTNVSNTLQSKIDGVSNALGSTATTLSNYVNLATNLLSFTTNPGVTNSTTSTSYVELGISNTVPAGKYWLLYVAHGEGSSTSSDCQSILVTNGINIPLKQLDYESTDRFPIVISGEFICAVTTTFEIKYRVLNSGGSSFSVYLPDLTIKKLP